MKLESVRSFLVETFNEWSADKVMQVAAAVAYYATFSLAPLLVIFRPRRPPGSAPDSGRVAKC
jgi:uncharacterized BrkB/YihY/UPF0761 family membrane protein